MEGQQTKEKKKKKGKKTANLSEDFLGENKSGTPTSLIGLGLMEREQRILKGKPRWARTTPAGVGPLSCLERVLLTAYSMNFACVSYHGL